MIDIFSSILYNVLAALYQPFCFSLLLSILYLYFYLYSIDKENAGKGYKNSILTWINCFRKSKDFRKYYYLVFYTSMILFRTLLNRNLWLNPLSNVIGNWWIYAIDSNTGEVQLTTECLENFILFVPFSMLLLWKLDLQTKIVCNIWGITKIVFLFSCMIEFLQLFLRLGTFQLSDLFYNTLGGFVGGIIYFSICKIHKRLAERENKNG